MLLDSSQPPSSLSQRTFGTFALSVYLVRLGTDPNPTNCRSVVERLHVPITPGLAETATFLPVANFAAMRYITNKPRSAQSKRPEWDIKTGIVRAPLLGR